MAESTAWKTDAEGYYLEMLVGEKKQFSLSWADELGSDTLSSVVWTINGNVTKVSQAESSPIGQVTLQASGAAGVWPCSAKMTSSSGNIIDIFPFRVVIA